MPRSAATIFGLALAAISIGFNTVRYPLRVGNDWSRTSRRESAVVGAIRAGGTRESSANAAATCRTATTSRSPATEGRADCRQAGPVVAQKSVAKKPQPAAPGPESGRAAADKKPAASPKVAAAEPKPQKRLVPVTQVSRSNAPADAATVGTVIRRLPPVEPVDPNATNGNAAPTPDGSIPVYPTTGIE